MLRFSLVIGVLLFASMTQGADLVANARIVRIASSSNGFADDFFIEVVGGSGPCANGSIIFPRSQAPTEAFFGRMFAIALTAYATENANVRVYAPSSNVCNAAKFIQIAD